MQFVKCIVWNIASASHDFAFVVVTLNLHGFCIVPTNQHLSTHNYHWKVFWVFFKPLWHESPSALNSAGGAWISQQSNACSDCPNAFKWHKQNSQQVSNFMDIDYFVSELRFHPMIHILICSSHWWTPYVLPSSTEVKLLLNLENVCSSCCLFFKGYFQHFKSFCSIFLLFTANIMMCCSLKSAIFLVCHT